MTPGRSRQPNPDRRRAVAGPGTYTSPWHYDSGESPGLHADFNYNPGPGNVHTLLSIVATCDVGTPYRHVDVRYLDGTNWTSPLIPIGTGTISQAQINAQGFVVLEDIGSITAEP